MAYECIEELLRESIDRHFYDEKANNVDYKIFEELQEVYKKAKAWDNYIEDVRERVRFTENTEVYIESETQKVIDYYMEDE